MGDITQLTLRQEYAHAKRRQYTAFNPSMLGTKGHSTKTHAPVSHPVGTGSLSNIGLGTKGRHSTATYALTLRQVGTKGHQATLNRA